MRTRLTTFFAGALLVLALGVVTKSTHAAVVLDDSVNFTTNSDPDTVVRQDTYTFDNTTDLGGFDPTGSDKLVVAFGSENANGIDSITYGGVPLTPALYDDGSRELAVFYLDNPTTNGDLFINPSNGTVNGLGGTLFALSGTATGFDQTSVSNGSSTSIVVDSGSMVIAIGVKNQGTPPGAVAPLIGTFSGGSGSSATGVGYQNVVTGGTVMPTFTNSPEQTGAVEFEMEVVVIPTPSALPIGMALLVLVAISRKK